MYVNIQNRLVLASGLAAIFAGGAAFAAPEPQSTAIGISASFRSQGIATQITPVASVSGQPSGTYNVSQKVANASQASPITAGFPSPAVYVNARDIESHASASGLLIDSRGSEGDTSLASATIALNLIPPPPVTTPVPAPVLSMSVKELNSSANYNQVFGTQPLASGSTTIGSLVLSGQLVGTSSVKFSGTAAPNTVIYQSPTVTVTLNRQLESAIISCSLVCTFTVVKIDVAAVDVELHDAMIYGHKVSGDILVGEATAQ